MQVWSKVLNPVTPRNRKNFDSDKTDESWDWLLRTK
jgi:hypothetical protein